MSLRLTQFLGYLNTHPYFGLLPVFVLFLIMLLSLVLLGDATQNSQSFERLYALLLIVNFSGVILLLGLIGHRIIRFVREFRSGVIGTRLALRLVIMFIVVAAVPVSAVYYFSLQFLQKGIDSWFDVRIEQALQDALELSRNSMDLRIKELVRENEQMAQELADGSDNLMAMRLSELHSRSDSAEFTLLSYAGRVIASSVRHGMALVPKKPEEAILFQVRQGYNYVGLDPIEDQGLFVRVVTLVPDLQPLQDPRILQSLYPVSGRVNDLLDNVNDAFAYYKELVYLRGPLMDSFVVTLSLVLISTLLTAVWVAFYASQRLIEPVRVLAAGTRSVASGDYNQQLPALSDDEFGSLVESFNDMTQKIALARDDVKQSQRQAERERAYLRAVLGGLTSGVLTLDQYYRIRTINAAARQILEVDFDSMMGKHLGGLVKQFEHMQEFVTTVLEGFGKQQQDWREQVVIFGSAGRKVLMCRGTTLSKRRDNTSGYVLVFDDITALIQAQRDAAWSEVARRLAHEIKNPLTPIQLAAERIRRKYLPDMSEQEAGVLDRSTHTIVQQVQAMEEMVKAFAEYAYVPKLHWQELDLHGLLEQVLELYRGHRNLRIVTEYLGGNVRLCADPGRLRQLLHNLLKNALEAVADRRDGQIRITTQLSQREQEAYVELRVEDNGPGIPEQMLDQLFEPYVTTKPKGTGLGLAIVKKIVEEHGGMVRAENLDGYGAVIIIRLPLNPHGGDKQGAADNE